MSSNIMISIVSKNDLDGQNLLLATVPGFVFVNVCSDQEF
jgi:hypothetical protein